MILVIGAMVEELDAIIHQEKMVPVADSPFVEFKSENGEVIVCATGIGTVNAGAGLSYLLTKYQKTDFILALGTAGAIDDSLKQGDLVLIEKAIYASVDVRSFGYQLGQVPRMPISYQASEKLLSQSQKILASETYKLTNTATLDIFVDQLEQVKKMIRPLPIKTQIAEMEVASYYQVALLFQKPIMAIKIISDSLISQAKSSTEFDDFLPLSTLRLKKIYRELIKKLKI